MKLLFLFSALLVPFSSYEQTTLDTDSLQGRVDSTELIFCGGVENGLPVGISDRFFSDTLGNAYIYAYYSQPTPLMMKQVMMEVHIEGNEDTSGMRAFSVKPKWKYTFMKYYITTPGIYRITLYDESKNILARGMITIVHRER